MTSKTNAEKQDGKGTPEMKVEKNTTLKPASTKNQEVKQPTVEELQKQIEDLKGKLNSVPKDLDSRIEYFNHKKELIRKLGTLKANAQSLQTHLDTISELAAANDFETEEYMLSIEGGGKYNRKQIFALQNPVLIGEVITYLLGKVEAKVLNLQKEIEA